VINIADARACSPRFCPESALSSIGQNGYGVCVITPTTGALRLARAAVVAGIVVALAGGAHVLGGGALPPTLVTVALGALVLAVAAVVAGRRMGWIGSIALLGAGQLALHGVFSLFETSGCATLVPTGSHAHMDHAAHVAFLQAAGCSPSGMSAMVGGLGAWAMVVMHALGTLAAVAAITGVDRALWWLAAWLRPLVERVVVPARPAWGPLPVATDHESFSRQVWRRAVPLRGPPSWEHPVPTVL